jgi:hypothetical protein
MTKYDIIFESLQEKVNSGELSMDDARILNDVAFEKYSEDDTEYEELCESCDEEDSAVTYEEYLEAMEYELFGEATRLSKEIVEKRKRAQLAAKQCKDKIDDLQVKRYRTCDTDEKIDLTKKIDKYQSIKKKNEDLDEYLSDRDTIAAGHVMRDAVKNNKKINRDYEEISGDLKRQDEELKTANSKLGSNKIKAKINRNKIEDNNKKRGEIYLKQYDLNEDFKKNRDESVDKMFDARKDANEKRNNRKKYTKSLNPTE